MLVRQDASSSQSRVPPAPIVNKPATGDSPAKPRIPTKYYRPTRESPVVHRHPPAGLGWRRLENGQFGPLKRESNHG